MSEYFRSFLQQARPQQRALVVRADLIGIHFTERR